MSIAVAGKQIGVSITKSVETQFAAIDSFLFQDPQCNGKKHKGIGASPRPGLSPDEGLYARARYVPNPQDRA
jgi:hypothetical protein